jgi:hypothetical protein
MHSLIYIICFLGLVQQYWGNTAVNNAVTSVSTSTGTGTDSGGLGLVYNVGKMYIKKSLVNSLIGILLPSTKDYYEYTETMKKIRAELRKLETMDILKVDPYKTDCNSILTAITVDIDNIQKAIVDMGKFSDNSAPEPKNYNCLSPGDLQHMVVNYCDKTSNGLFCEISLNIQYIRLYLNIIVTYQYLTMEYNLGLIIQIRYY